MEMHTVNVLPNRVVTLFPKSAVGLAAVLEETIGLRDL